LGKGGKRKNVFVVGGHVAFSLHRFMMILKIGENNLFLVICTLSKICPNKYHSIAGSAL
jgi:hypothetical protein